MLLGDARLCRTGEGAGGTPIEHRLTPYDLDETERRYHESGDPLTAEMIEILRQPPTPAEVIRMPSRWPSPDDGTRGVAGGCTAGGLRRTEPNRA